MAVNSDQVESSLSVTREAYRQWPGRQLPATLQYMKQAYRMGATFDGSDTDSMFLVGIAAGLAMADHFGLDLVKELMETEG